MSRRAFSLLVAMALTLVIAVAATGAVQAASSKARAKEKAEHARVVKYWTPARMANAKPRDFVKTDKGFVPAARGGNKPPKEPTAPGDGAGSGGSSTTVTGASWDIGGPAMEATGKVFFTMDGGNWVCSGAVVQDSRQDASMVLTAGHCAYDETNRAFATNWMFIPGYDENPSGRRYSAKALVVHSGYANAGSFNSAAIKHDWAFAVVGPVDASGILLEDQVPEFAYAFDAKPEARHAFGYPAQGKYGGGDLVYCAGDTITDPKYDTWGLACDMTSGASGGPWIRDFSTAQELNSVNSYKYLGGKFKNYMFGPKFDGRTWKTYEVALAAAGNDIASGTK